MEKYMYRALELAKKGIGMTSPNPIVGAVIVKNGNIIGEGWHQKYGESHAEINAFNNATEDVSNSHMYITLEPCSHYGKTPPCTSAIIDKKIKKVFIGMKDPNELVSGKGIAMLKQAGIEVQWGMLEHMCNKQNEVYLKYITKKTPFVIMKTAMTLDGKICSYSGNSKWITCEKSREYVHKLRSNYSAIMVGANTIINDNPMLTSRLPKGKNPIRIIVDSQLRIPCQSKALLLDINDRCIIATTERADPIKLEKLKHMGIEIIITKSKDGKVNLSDLMLSLGKLKIDSILLEGGGTLNYSALKEGIVDKVISFISPKIIGGIEAKTPVEGQGIEAIENAIILKDLEVNTIDEDIIISGYIR